MSADVPTGWRRVALADVATESRTRNDGSYSASDLHGVLKHAGLVPMRDRVKGKSVERCKVVKPGGFAYNPMRINIGSIARSNLREPVLVSPDYMVFDCVPERIRDEYLDQLRHSHIWTQFVESAGRGSVRTRIYFSQLGTLCFPLPPLPEQRKIAAILSSVDEAIQATEVVIEQTRRVKEGLLQDFLTKGIGHSRFKETKIGRVPETWDVKRLGELSTKITDGDHHTPKRETSGVYLLSCRNVRDGFLDLSDVDFVGESEYERMIKRCQPEPGDILISCSGTIGRVAEVPEGLRCVLVRSAALVKLRRAECAPTFALWALRSRSAKRQIRGLQRQGAQANLFQSEIARILLPVPPLAEQERLAALLDGHSGAEQPSRRSLAALLEVKAGLLQDLLTGKVRVSA